jgi:hypothetical protein
MNDVDSISKSKITLRVQRQSWTKDAIFGRITVSGEGESEAFKGYSMERIAVAIPVGTYNARLRYSAHFDMTVPGIDVPSRTDIEIHPANYPAQLEGCIAIGSSINGDALDNSRVAFAGLIQDLPETFLVTIT